MKLKNIVIALACSGLLALNVVAAPTEIHQLEFEDKTTFAKIKSDENKLTQVKVRVGEDKQTFTFTQDELTDPQVIKDKLSSLPKASATKVAHLLSRMANRQDLGFDLIVENELDPKTLLKIEKISRLMETKGHEMEAKAREFEVHVAQMESHAHEMEAKAMALEIYFDQHEEEFDIIMNELADEVSEITSNFSDIEIEIHEGGADSQHVFIFHGDEKSDITQHLIESIKQSELTEEQKQAIRDALN
ncbi:hypothetical protein Sps_00425 [Shewanella psychrophila]|uniref:DUF5667 domain-containing protein n=1 Tax=Shewanella psychrophila TaxID=225848 RepID=A0A1S6HJD8_9GAMM|nr:hypothetical protein [Shewanella psychrophila]AQS35630.1 hypothetical protein Sps_00425 [Shewanella psychrophila]